MFLSLVETADDSNALSLRRSDMFIKRYNVAASRARNQLWVVGALDPDAHLKAGDLREMLIRHALDPQRTIAEVAEMNPRDTKESESVTAGSRRMSQALQRELEGAGYRVCRDFPVGSYRLDLVVEGRNQRVAIRCDGDREHAPDRFKVMVEREAVLERLGWRFVSLRASQYYREPYNTIQTLLKRLRELGLEPAVGGLGDPQADDGSALYQRIRDRAAQLQRIWRGEEENVPLIQVHKPLLDMPRLPTPPMPMTMEGELPSIPSIPDVPETSFTERMAQRIASLGGDTPAAPAIPSLPDPLPPMAPFPPSLSALPGLAPLDSLSPLPPAIPSLDSLAPLPPLGSSLDMPLGIPSLPSSLSLDLPPLPSVPGIPEAPQGSEGAPGWKDLFGLPKNEDTQASFIPLQIPDPPKRSDEKLGPQ